MASLHKGGLVGDKFFDWMSYLLGVGYYLLPALFFILGASFAREVKTDFATVRILGSIIFILSGLGIIDIAQKGEGGLLGNLVSMPMIKLFDVTAGLLILSALLVVSIVIIFDTTPDFKSLMFWRKKKDQDGYLEEENFDEEIDEEIVAEEQETEEPEETESKLKGILSFTKKEKTKISVIAAKIDDNIRTLINCSEKLLYCLKNSYTFSTL